MAAVTAALIAAGTAAYSANQSKKQQEKAAKAAAAGQNSTTVSTPWAPFAPNLNTIATDSLANYTRMRDNPVAPPRRGSYGSGQQVAGASGLEQQLADSAGQRAMGGNRLLDSASGSLENLYGGGNHPLLQGAYNSAQNFSNPFLNEQVARQQRGSGSRASGLIEGLYGEWAGSDAMNAGNQAYNDYYTQGQQAPTNLGQEGGGDIFGGMTSSGGKQGIGASGYRSASSGGGGGQAGPKSKLQEAYEAEMLRTMQGEYQDAESNPHIQQQIDMMKRDADSAYASRSAQINQSADGLGRFGSSPWMALNRQNEGLYNQEYLDRAGDLRFENYGMERGHMQSALDRMLAQNNAEMSDRTARAGISAGSRSAQAGIDAQLSMARDSNKLGLLGLLGQMEGQNQDYMGSLLGTQTQAGLSALGIQGQLGQSAAANQISALGLAPQTSDAYYTGYGVAGGLAGQVRQGNQAAQSANQQAAAAAANARYQDEMQQWAWGQEHQWDNLNNLYNLTMGPATAFGTSKGNQQLPPAYGIGSGPDPWGAALSTGLGTYMAFQNTQSPMKTTGSPATQSQPQVRTFDGLPVSGGMW
jgi:hypothetical protein